MVIGIGGSAWLAFKAWDNPEKQIELQASQWACSQAVELWQPPYSCGGKIRRTCGGYYYTACRQWTHRTSP